MNNLPREFILKTAGVLLETGYSPNLDLHIKDGFIESISEPANVQGIPAIDLTDHFVLPGMSNNHTHCAMNFLRGYTHGHTAMIKDIFFTTESQLTESLVEDLSYPYILSGLRSGVTHFNEHYYHHKGIARAFENMGVRAHIGQWIGDIGGAIPYSPNWVDIEHELVNWEFSNRIKPILCPHAADTVSKPVAKQLTEFAEANGLNLHFHLSQRREEIEFCKTKYNQSPVEFALEVGWLKPTSLAVHLIYSSESDRKIISDSGVYIGACPSSQIIYDHLAPIEKYWNNNPVLLGTDCAASNDQGDMLVELNTLAKFMLDRGSGAPDLYKQLIATANSNAGDFFKQPMGKIAPGMFADLVFVEQAPELMPIVDIETSIIFAIQAQYVKHVMVDGKWVLWNREPVERNTVRIKSDYLNAIQQIKFPSGL